MKFGGARGQWEYKGTTPALERAVRTSAVAFVRLHELAAAMPSYRATTSAKAALGRAMLAPAMRGETLRVQRGVYLAGKAARDREKSLQWHAAWRWRRLPHWARYFVATSPAMLGIGFALGLWGGRKRLT